VRQQGPKHCDTDQLGSLVMQGLGSSPRDGGVEGIQTTYCPHLLFLTSIWLLRKAAGGIHFQRGGSQEALRGR
jgi:hypothetical protein